MATARRSRSTTAAFLANADQLDTDGDLSGNVCDADDDNDGLLDAVETNAESTSGPTTPARTRSSRTPTETATSTETRSQQAAIPRTIRTRTGPEVPGLPLPGFAVLAAALAATSRRYLRPSPNK